MGDVGWVKLLLSAAVIVVGWFASSWLSARRARNDKRRELVLEHLVTAYRTLTQTVGRRTTTGETQRAFENTLTEVQLFGTKAQAALARKIAHETAESGSSTIDPLIVEMRRHLRAELGLDDLHDQTIWLRFNREDV